jgi:hypothetical protein
VLGVLKKHPQQQQQQQQQTNKQTNKSTAKHLMNLLNPFTASCENAMTLSVPGVPASCEKFPHSSQLNF